eukprot:12642-Pelagococcus_subviridis.AAC.4
MKQQHRETRVDVRIEAVIYANRRGAAVVDAHCSVFFDSWNIVRMKHALHVTVKRQIRIPKLAICAYVTVLGHREF